MTSGSACSGCGAVIEGAEAGCQRLFDRFRVRELAELARGYPSTRLTVDLYCLQHPNRYCVSAKSFAAHLTGLAWAVERGGDEYGLRVLQRWLNSPGDLVKPQVPVFRGTLSIVDMTPGVGPAEYADRLRRWADSVWEAYSSLHQVARDWIDDAFRSASR